MRISNDAFNSLMRRSSSFRESAWKYIQLSYLYPKFWFWSLASWMFRVLAALFRFISGVLHGFAFGLQEAKESWNSGKGEA